MDVTTTVRDINHFIGSLGFSPRDSDGSDFQRGSDTSLRFKTGTTYGEVTVTVWYGSQCVETIRILNEDQAIDAKRKIERLAIASAFVTGTLTPGRYAIQRRGGNH